MKTHLKTRYTKKGEPKSKKVKAHIGDKIKFVKKSGYEIPIGTTGRVISIIKSESSDAFSNYTDYHYKIKLRNGKIRYVMAATTWKVIE